jgi:uncharacterized protein YjbI with pentapeptide repeats
VILKQGVEVWNRWRNKRTTVRDPDVSRADLSSANLVGVNLRGTNLSRAKLRQAKASFADFSGADLIGADLTELECIGTAFNGADLTKTKLRRAKLLGVAFSFVQVDGVRAPGVTLFRDGPNLTGADFTDAQVGYCIFSKADLSKAKGLESVIHTLPSSVDIATLFASKGHIPDAFLRGCGCQNLY